MPTLDLAPYRDRMALAERRLAAAYACTPGAAIPVVEPGVSFENPSVRDQVMDVQAMRRRAVNWVMALAATDNDWPPFIDTHCTVVTLAEAFGCPVVYPESGDAWTQPALGSVQEVWALRPTPLAEVPSIRRLAAWVDYAQRELGTELPMWTIDLQSPFSVAAHILPAEELLMACLTDPPAVHHLCRMITDASIELMTAHLRQLEHPGFPGRNFPSISANIGICLADDTPLVMLSPALYAEFALPYNSAIGVAFGGIHLHCCGDYSHNLANVLRITNLRSIQMHVGPGEFRLPLAPGPAAAWQAARGRVARFVDTNGVARGDNYRGLNQRHYDEYLLPRNAELGMEGLILQSCGVGDACPDVPAALAWTRGRVAAGRF